MPQSLGRIPAFRAPKDLQVLVDSFNGGLNTFSRPTELKDNELAQADNLMLIGTGVPTQRWGSAYYNLVGSGRIRFLQAYYRTTDSTNHLLAISDTGLLVKKNGASYTVITGASFASGLNYQGAELGNNMYISAATLPFVKYDGSTLIPYLALTTPSLSSLAVISAVSNQLNLYSWRITALSVTGETLGSPARTAASLPINLEGAGVFLAWNAVSAASGMLKGYNIYRGTPGNERFLATVDPTVTSYTDHDSTPSSVINLPFSDTTAGVRAKYILKFDDRLILAGVAEEPSKVYISGRYPNHDRFTAIDGGGWGLAGPDDGDEITGLGIAGNQGMSSTGSGPPPSAVLIFKKKSIHRLIISLAQFGNYLVVDPQIQLLTASNGASSGDTIVPVENDTFYFGDQGMFTVGQEPTFLNQIRTNEISARNRPYFEALTDSDRREATAGYLNKKYLISFPTRKETMVYDRERLAFMGPWKTPFGVTKWLSYIDANGTKAYLAGTDTGAVYEFSPSYVSDNGTAISKVLRTKKFDMKAWSIMKMLKMVYTLFRNVRGQVNVNVTIETRSGSTAVTKSFTLSSDLGSSGWGNDEWGDTKWGDTDATIILTGEELARFARIFKQARVMQVEITADTANSTFEFLGLRVIGQGLGDNSLPSSDRV